MINLYNFFYSKSNYRLYAFLLFNFSIIWNLSAMILNNSEDSILSAFVNNIDNFNNNYPQEKIYLHFDNTAYFKGDTIWFKGYVINEGNCKFTDISRVLYVELLSPEGFVVDSRKLEIVEGQCHGEFTLHSYDRSGYYEIRAYTRYMLNWGSDWIFTRVFPVFEMPEKEGNYSQHNIYKYKNIYQIIPERESKVEDPKKVNVTFYPEGGSLVLGLTSRVAFKATDKNGQDIVISGIVPDSRVGINKIEVVHQGMGVFDFCPAMENEKVELLIDGKEFSFNLPVALKNGYVMRVDSDINNYLDIVIGKSSELKPETLGLSVLCRGKVASFRKIQIEKESILIKIHKDSLTVGVNQITLFNSKGRILCERLFFVNESRQKNIQLLTEKKLYNPNELVSLDFKTDPDAVFSISIRDPKGDVLSWNADIYTNLLLSSDIKGYIRDPGYYFEIPNDPKRKMALDILMLVQGWSRYNWKQQAAGVEFPYFHNYENGIILQGSLVPVIEKNQENNKHKDKDKDKEILSANLDSVLLYLEDFERLGKGKHYRITIKHDSTGRFRILWPDFKGKCPIRLRLVDKSNPDTSIHGCRFRILLDRVFDPAPRAYNFYEINADDIISDNSYEEQEKIAKEKRSIEQVQLLDEVIFEDKSVKYITLDVDREKTRWRDQGIDYPETFLEYLRNKGLNIKKVIADQEVKSQGVNMCYLEPKDDYKRDVLRDLTTHFYRLFIGSVYVDLGILRTGKWEKAYNRHSLIYGSRNSSVSRIPLSQIKKIKIYDDINFTFIYPVDKKTYRSKKMDVFFEPYAMSDSIDDLKPHIRTTNLEGYSVSKESYVGKLPTLPDYMDYRRTIYWNPNIKADSFGNTSITFYNNSRCSEFVISAEGLTIEGVPILFNNKYK